MFEFFYMHDRFIEMQNFQSKVKKKIRRHSVPVTSTRSRKSSSESSVEDVVSRIMMEVGVRADLQMAGGHGGSGLLEVTEEPEDETEDTTDTTADSVETAQNEEEDIPSKVAQKEFKSNPPESRR